MRSADLSPLRSSGEFSVMHRCLHIAEVVDVIASHVHRKRDLLSMGLVCQAFHEPAMKNLWRHLEDIEPLVRCLPPHTRGAELSDQLVRDFLPSVTRYLTGSFHRKPRRSLKLQRRLNGNASSGTRRK